jgi:photosystem II stability/assembly factor-like uncharacterized protein
MRTKILFLLLLIGSLNLHAQEWGYINTLTDEWLRKICTQGLDTVYIVGENGLIAQSTDRGETWNKQHFSTSAALNDIIFIDHYTGLAVGDQGTILKTTDAGGNWAAVTSGVTSTIHAIAATGSDNIWAVGDNSLVLRSIDGGETWEPVNILPETDRQLLDIEFRDNLGYFTGNYATVYKTEDYGATWIKQNLADAPNDDATFYAINTMENKTHLMSNKQYLFSTENQINWNQTWLSFIQPIPFFIDDNTGYIFITLLPVGGSYGLFLISKTENGGINWSDLETIKPSIDSDLYLGKTGRITVVNDTLGYAIVGQVLLKTPALPASPPQGIKKIENSDVLKILQTEQKKLLIQSGSKPVLSVEIFDISGNKLAHNQWINPVKEININTDNYALGVYVIKTTHCDNTISINKYIKR